MDYVSVATGPSNGPSRGTSRSKNNMTLSTASKILAGLGLRLRNGHDNLGRVCPKRPTSLVKGVELKETFLRISCSEETKFQC